MHLLKQVAGFVGKIEAVTLVRSIPVKDRILCLLVAEMISETTEMLQTVHVKRAEAELQDACRGPASPQL